jgi:hypothetical protein
MTKAKRRFCLGGLILLSLLALAACAAPPVDDGQLIEYRSTTFGFRVSHPAVWQVLEDPPPLVGDNPTDLHAVAFLPSQDTKVLITVFVQTLTQTQTLDQYVETQMASLQSNELNAKFTDPAPIDLGGLKGVSTSATLTSNNEQMLERLVLAVNGRQAYGVTFFGPTGSDLLPAFEALLESFALVQ